jgi:hypothetical protein
MDLHLIPDGSALVWLPESDLDCGKKLDLDFLPGKIPEFVYFCSVFSFFMRFHFCIVSTTFLNPLMTQ